MLRFIFSKPIVAMPYPIMLPITACVIESSIPKADAVISQVEVDKTMMNAPKALISGIIPEPSFYNHISLS
jgi:hypothetical protein